MNQSEILLRQNQAEPFTHPEVDGNWQELDNRTKHNEDGYNSIAELAANLQQLISQLYLPTQVLAKGYNWAGNYSYNIIFVKWVHQGVVHNVVFNQLINLAAADATYNRYDLVVINLDTNTLGVVPGDATAQPTYPIIADNQLMVTPITVYANTTEPTGSSNEDVYLDNAQWEATVVGNVDPDDVADPETGPKAIYFNNADLSDRVILTRGVALATDGAAFVLLSIKLVTAGNQNKFKLVAYSDTANLGAVPIEHNIYGFNKNNVDSYQHIAIPAADLGLVAGAEIKRFDFGTSDGGVFARVDNFKIQFGEATTPGEGDFLPTGGYAGTAQDLYDLILAGGLTPEQLAKLNALNRSYDFAVNNESEDLVVDAVVPIYTDILREPFAGWNNTRVTASAPDGDILEFEIYVNGVLKDTVSIDSLETDSAEAATPSAVIGAPIDLVAGDKIEVFCTNIGSTAAGGAYAKMSLQHI